MLQKICNVLLVIIMIGALGLAFTLGVPKLQGNDLYAVLTESMEPTYPVGSIVVIERVDGTQVQVDDVITFEAAGFSEVVTHRVIEIDEANGLLYTKGDNNESADFFPVSVENVRGRVIKGIPHLGNLVSAMYTPVGILALAWFGFIVIMLVVLPGIVEKSRQNRLGEESVHGQQT